MGLAAVEPWDFAVAARRIRTRVEQIGDLVDSYAQQLPERAAEQVRIFVQYADRCQIDLVLLPATAGTGFAPSTKVLYDPDNLVTTAHRCGRRWNNCTRPERTRGGWPLPPTTYPTRSTA
jgi:hypothetical protein